MDRKKDMGKGENQTAGHCARVRLPQVALAAICLLVFIHPFPKGRVMLAKSDAGVVSTPHARAFGVCGMNVNDYGVTTTRISRARLVFQRATFRALPVQSNSSEALYGGAA